VKGDDETPRRSRKHSRLRLTPGNEPAHKDVTV
jgi:hypothetical protein